MNASTLFLQHCGKVFSEPYKLRRHLREVHDNLKEHICSTCGKSFARADKLFQHELIHVSKSEQPVEWVPIAKENLPQNETESSDESSDSSTDADDAMLDELLEAHVKEEEMRMLKNHVKSEEEDKDEDILQYVQQIKDEDLEHWEDSEPPMSDDNGQGLDESEDEEYRPRELRTTKSKNVDQDIDSQSFYFEDDLQSLPDGKDSNVIKNMIIKENKGLLQKINDSQWDSDFTCSECSVSVPSLKAAFDHMLMAHPIVKTLGDGNEDLPSEIDLVACIECGAPFKGWVQFQIHLWRHHNNYEVPKRGGRKKRGFWHNRRVWPCVLCPGTFFGEGLGNLLAHRKRIHEDLPLFACPSCDLDTHNEPALLAHFAQNHLNEKPNCQLCGKTFFNNNKLRRHITEVHEGRKSYMCNECGKCFARPDKLRDHEKIHENPGKSRKRNALKQDLDIKDEVNDDSDTNENSAVSSDLFKVDFLDSDCDENQKETESQQEYQNRIESHHSALDSANQVDTQNGQAWHQRASFACYRCQENMTGVSTASKHMESQHDRPLGCILCPKILGTAQAYLIHLWRHFQKALHCPNTTKWLDEQFWKCKKCDLDIEGLNGFWKHELDHHGVREINCPGCDRGNFADQKAARRHVNLQHGVKLPCEFCGKFFNAGSKMKRHILEVHENRKNHTCQECGKSFARPEKLRLHQDLHAEGTNRPFLCHQCGRGFVRQEHVSRHQKICGKKKSRSKFRLRADAPIDETELETIAIELGIHGNLQDDGSDVKTPCKFCDKSFRNKRYMMEHYVRHHREANQRLPHRCEVCGKGFKVIRDLTRHHNRPHTKYFHSEEYLSLKFVCPEDGCCRRFKKERALAKHILIHKNIRNFKCDQCNMAFCTRQTLRTHTKMQHNIILPTESKKGKKLGPRKAKTQVEAVAVEEPQIEANLTTVENNWANPQSFFSNWTTSIGIVQPARIFVEDEQQQQQQDNISNQSMDVPSLDAVEDFEPQKSEDCVKSKKSNQQGRLNQSLLSEEQKQLVQEEMNEANLGLLCNVCGKIYKSKDALDFHIMYTKMPGHDILQQQRVKNNYAQESMRIAAKLSNENDIMPEEEAECTKEDLKGRKSASKIFKCMECHRGFKRENKLIKHVTRKHNTLKKAQSQSLKPAEGALKLTPMGCPDCNLLFDNVESLLSHFKAKNLNLDLSNKCPVSTCDMNFASRDKLIEHLSLGKHGQNCPQCGKSFAKLDNLELHVRSHFTERPFACNDCDKSYKDAPSLYSHQQAHHVTSKRTHLCSECGASFMKSDHLKRHINSTHR